MTVVFGDTRMPKRFWKKLSVTARECWEMPGKPDAYGMFWLDGKVHGAHRLAWQRLVGPIEGDLVVDHLCRNKPCCNPNHFELVTTAVNVQRGYSPLDDISTRTHCSKGHELTADNVLDSRVPYKHCKTCRTDWIALMNERSIDDDDWLWYDDE